MLNLPKQSEADKLAWPKQAWKKGAASGNVGPLDAEDLKRQAQRQGAAKA